MNYIGVDCHITCLDFAVVNEESPYNACYIKESTLNLMGLKSYISYKYLKYFIM